MKLFPGIAGAICAGLLLCSAAAQESLTLRKIREAGMVSIGYRDASMPFSYLDDKQRPIGYSMDICYRIVDALKAKLNMPGLQVRLTLVNTANRIPLVANGSIDLECGVTTNTVERQRLMAFTVTTFVAASRIAGKKSSNINTIADLKGRSVVSTVGTTTMRRLPELSQSHDLNLDIMIAKDDLEAFRMLETDRADAFAMDDVLLRSYITSAKNPADYMISEEALSIEPYAIALSKDDPGFKKVADDAIIAMFKSGEIMQLYRKWFETPIPPKGMNLQLPMNAALKKAIAKNLDSGDPADYR